MNNIVSYVSTAVVELVSVAAAADTAANATSSLPTRTNRYNARLRCAHCEHLSLSDVGAVNKQLTRSRFTSLS